MVTLLIYALIMTTIVVIKHYSSKSSSESFLAADRRLSGLAGSMSIAASWIWAPAIFISSKVGYLYGFSGLFWFCIPNMLALLIFAPFAKKVCSVLPAGYSYVEYAKKFGKSYWHIQLYLQLLMQIVIFAIQLTAGATLLSTLMKDNYYLLVCGMAMTPLAYSTISGLRASVFCDAIQYCLILAGVALLLCNFPFSTLVERQVSFEFQPIDRDLLIEFGISSALGLIVAIFADQQQWQRAFAAKNNSLVRTFSVAGLLHLLITAGLGTFGWLIAQSGFISSNPELIGVDFVLGRYTTSFIIVYIIMALCALISTLDSGLCAFSSLWTTQLRREKGDTDIIKRNRIQMLVLAVLGSLIACIRLDLVNLWFIAGVIRLCTFAPTVSSIIFKGFDGKQGFNSIIAAFVIAAPVFGYGLIYNQPLYRTVGMLAAIFVGTLWLMTAAWISRKINS